MKITIDLPDLKEAIEAAVEASLADHQTKLFGWKYYTLKETAELLQIKISLLLDRRQPYLNEIDYSQKGKIFWFVKKSVEAYVEKRKIKKYRR